MGLGSATKPSVPSQRDGCPLVGHSEQTLFVWKAVEKANLATKEPKKKHEEITLEDLHEWVTGQCKDLTPEQKLTASLGAS